MGTESRAYAIVEQVKIENIDDSTVSFTTRTASKSGDRDDCVRRTFAVPRPEVWSTPIDGAPPPVAMKPGAIGNLFLSQAGWQTASADGYKIYGAGTDQPPFKYPDRGAAPRFLGELIVIPSSIVIHAAIAGGSSFVDIDLFGPDAADAQDVRWNGAEYIQLHLTPHGAHRLQLAPGTTAVQMWSTRIVVAGAPVVDPTSPGSVDLLDSEMAGSVQHLTYDRRGARLSLCLTQDGFGAFHVVPGLHETSKPHHTSPHHTPPRRSS
jgi:hypothetical protein